MKFLCVECDEAMSLEEAHGPDEGAMTVVFQCPTCGQQTAMLTNPMETQVVSSLGVSIGEEEEKTSAEPMEMVRSSLSEQAGGTDGATSSEDAHEDGSSDSGSKCPFTDVVTSAEEEQEDEPEKATPSTPRWTADAEERLSNIPSFAQSMARKSIEQHAEEQGYATIDTDVMDEVKGQFGM